MTSKKKCLVVVFLPVGELARYPDQMARFRFLEKHYEVVEVITSSNTGLPERYPKHLIDHANPLIFSWKLARRLRADVPAYDFIYVIGLPAVIAFGLRAPQRPVVVYGPTHYEQHFGLQSARGLVSRAVAHLKQALLFRGLRKVASVMAISRQLAELYQPLAPRVTMIPMGVDLSLYPRRAAAPAPPRSLNIVYPGSGGAGRGIDLMLAFARLAVTRCAPVRLHLIGCNDALLQAALGDAPELSSVIQLYPLTPYAEVVMLYGQMDAGISLLENNRFYAVCPPQKIFEYMAAGLPVICNRIATHTDYVADNALMVEWNAEALYAGVMQMASNYPYYATAAARFMPNLQQYDYIAIEKSFLNEIAAACAWVGHGG